jgi:hypothetical protein
MKCMHCGEKEYLSRHCEIHWALGVFFQYECGHLWHGKDLMAEYIKWLDELSESEKMEIFKTYWKGG